MFKLLSEVLALSGERDLCAGRTAGISPLLYEELSGLAFSCQQKNLRCGTRSCGVEEKLVSCSLNQYPPLSLPGEHFHVNTESTDEAIMSNLSKGGTKKDTKMRIRAFPVSAHRSRCSGCQSGAHSIPAVSTAG